MPRRAAVFDIATLDGDAATVVRHALAGIDGRRHARQDSKRDWLRDGYKI